MFESVYISPNLPAPFPHRQSWHDTAQVAPAEFKHELGQLPQMMTTTFILRSTSMDGSSESVSESESFKNTLKAMP